MPYTQFTLTELQQQLAVKWESVPFWTATESTFALNEAFRIWNMLTGVWKGSATVVTPTVSPSPWLAVPSGIMYPIRMTWASTGYSLGRSSIGDLDNGRVNWEAENTATGGSVPNKVKVFAPAGLTLFAIWPYDAVGGNRINVEGVVYAPQLVNPTDTVDINNDSLQPILGYALHYAAFKEGGARWAATQGYYKEFLLAAMDQNDRLATSALFRKAAGLDINRGQRPLRVGLAEQQRQQG